MITIQSVSFKDRRALPLCWSLHPRATYQARGAIHSPANVVTVPMPRPAYTTALSALHSDWPAFTPSAAKLRATRQSTIWLCGVLG